MRTIVLSLLLVATPALAEEPATSNSAALDAKHPRAKVVDINSASVDELKLLPGVTDDVAKKIVAGRPYTGKDQLLKQNIVDKDEYAKIRPLIHAKQPKAIGGQGAVEKHEGPGPATDNNVKK